MYYTNKDASGQERRKLLISGSCHLHFKPFNLYKPVQFGASFILYENCRLKSLWQRAIAPFRTVSVYPEVACTISRTKFWKNKLDILSGMEKDRNRLRNECNYLCGTQPPKSLWVELLLAGVSIVENHSKSFIL